MTPRNLPLIVLTALVALAAPAAALGGNVAGSANVATDHVDATMISDVAAAGASASSSGVTAMGTAHAGDVTTGAVGNAGLDGAQMGANVAGQGSAIGGATTMKATGASATTTTSASTDAQPLGFWGRLMAKLQSLVATMTSFGAPSVDASAHADANVDAALPDAKATVDAVQGQLPVQAPALPVDAPALPNLG